MKYAEVKLMPLAADDREQFILDNQWSFKHGALIEFGERDNHIDEDGEIISRKPLKCAWMQREPKHIGSYQMARLSAELFFTLTIKHITMNWIPCLFCLTHIARA